MSAFFKKIFETLAPENTDPSKEASRRSCGVMSRQMVLDALVSHFDQEMEFESTKVSMLFHTSFVVYLNEEDYLRISPSFLMTAKDAVTMFLNRIKDRLPKYPNYVPHSRYWVLQLVNIPEGTFIDGVSDDEMGSNMIIVKSTIFPDDEYDASTGNGDGGRVVTTLHTKSSMKAMPKAMNMTALLGLDQLDKDKFRIRFDQENVLGLKAPNLSLNPPGMPSDPVVEPTIARLTADDGRFFESGRVFTTYQMKSDSLKICGRNGVAMPGESIVRVDSEAILNPHCVIRYDRARSTFFIAAVGPVKLNERQIPIGVSQWVLLPDRSTILLDDEVQLSFRIG